MATAPLIHDGQTVTRANEAEWLETRKNSLGASETPMALGISPYRTPLELWLLKTGGMEPEKPSTSMRLGKLLEPALLELYREECGQEVIAAQVFHRSEEHPFLTATLDGVREDETVIEMKVVGPWSNVSLGEDGSDDCPTHWLAQVQQQLLCSGLTRAEIAVLSLRGQPKLLTYPIQRDDKVIAAMVQRATSFWAMVQERRRPEPMMPRDRERIRHLFKDCVGAVELSPHLVADLQAYDELGAVIKDVEAKRSLAKANIQLAMENHALGTVAGWEVARRKIQRKEHVVKATEYTTLSVKKARSDDGNQDSAE